MSQAMGASSSPQEQIDLTDGGRFDAGTDGGRFDAGTDVGQVSVGALVGEVMQDISTLMRKEIELAKAEIRQEATKAGKGVGMLGGAGLAGWFTLLFLSLSL